MRKLHQRALLVTVWVTLLALVSLTVGPGIARAGITNWPQDTTLFLSGSNITLQILAGSQSDSLVVNPTNFVVTVAVNETFTVRYPGPNPGTLWNNGSYSNCTLVAGNNESTVFGGAGPVTYNPTTTPCVAPSGGGGGGGGGGGAPSYSATLSQPNGGETLTAGTSTTIQWTSNVSSTEGVRLWLSTDGGSTYPTAIASLSTNSGSYSWAIPSISTTTTARVRVEIVDSAGTLFAADASNANFTIQGTTTPPSTTPPSTVQPPVTEDTSATFKVKMLAPNGGESYPGGSFVTMRWDVAGDSNAGPVSAKPMLSTDGGFTWTTLQASVIGTTSYGFTLPADLTSKARVRVDVTDPAGGMASDMSDNDFAIAAVGTEKVETTYPPGDYAAVGLTDEEIRAPDVDPNAAGSGYSAGGAIAATPTINVDKNLIPPPPEVKTACIGGTLIKLQDDNDLTTTHDTTVYYCGKNGKRYFFPNARIFFTWFPDFNSVASIGAETMAKIPLAGNITYKPGVKMVKIQTDPKVYAIARAGLLRWVKDETVAVRLYGALWNQHIDDVPDSFFFNYKVGDPLE